MRHRNLVTIDLVAMRRRDKCPPRRVQMRDELVAKEIKIDPFGSAASFGAAEQRSIVCPRRRQVMYRDGKMKG